MKTTTAITTVKRDVQLQEWTEQIKAQQVSGMTVAAYSAQNGINIKTYYYHLRKVRGCCLESEPTIVPVAVPRATADVRIEENSLHISLLAYIPADTLLALVHELC
ncbi:MAG: IS66 family insertion sequence element accessory protein TnpB [Ruminococcus sp.]|nr:IS66 family insertion sequence element accessory protein TnpB [Ruminococcus sp.]